jgi:hypothetical protein
MVDSSELKSRTDSNFTAIREVIASQKEISKQQKENSEQQKETSKQIKELGKQIGGLGRKFGSFTEGLALPSMEKILQDKFKMEYISPSLRLNRGGRKVEIDVFAYANGDINEAYVVEVKSHLREEGILQLQKLMDDFNLLFPEHHNKKAYGILAAVDMSPELKQRVLDLGFYAAKIKDDVFSLDVPENFQAKAY